ncbi:MAG: sialate O-acetylesterase [Verrucomicrobiae bacterium]|nr:sialate O-acetylesterase [Verrucomicrobiae bacterium]NNJ86501.1 hypothetical protein [Akkermansiaceae bacterium]
MIRFTLWICMALAMTVPSNAGLVLAKVFTDHAVIQAGKPVKVWGTAVSKEAVTVQLGGITQKVSADDSGHWLATFGPMPASYQSFDLKVTDGHQTLTCNNLLAGEVWLANGQSNMQWALKQSTGGREAIKSCDDPHLRFFHHLGTLHPGSKKYPREFLARLNTNNYYQSNGWEPCDAKSAANFSAVAYFFAKKLRETLDVPVGIIALPVGGSPIEAHLPNDAFTSNPELKPLLHHWWKNPDYPQWCRQRAALNLTHWLADPEKGKAPPHPFAPTFLWQAGIDPLLHFPIKGVIWYQGESNATVDGGRGAAMPKAINHVKLVALINAYRRHWSDPSLPFYHVQLPGMNRDWMLFREMQDEVTHELTNLGMAVAIDVGHPGNVHPPDKQPVGSRLARLALSQVYGKNIECHGPLPTQITLRQSEVVIRFTHAKGLRSVDGRAPKTFELAGDNGIFHPATASIKKDSITLTSEEVDQPVAVRYAWADHPDVNLVNGSWLPAPPFRRKIK